VQARELTAKPQGGRGLGQTILCATIERRRLRDQAIGRWQALSGQKATAEGCRTVCQSGHIRRQGARGAALP